MIRKWMVILFALVFSSTFAWALEIGGIDMPDTFKAGDNSFVLNGAGLRTKFGIKVYGIGLYLKSKSSDASHITKADEAMALQMKWKRNIPSEKIDETFYKSFADVLKAPKADIYGPKSDYGPLTKDVVTFMSCLDKRAVTTKDSWIFVYTPGKGTEVRINDGTKDQTMAVIHGLDFKKALFSIWLGENPPVGESLKKDMLGKK